jgi:hypothetical protein
MLNNHVTDSFKIQSHAMYLDTSFNSTSTVHRNLHSAFSETATKMWSYARCLPVRNRPGTKLVISISPLFFLPFLFLLGLELM